MFVVGFAAALLAAALFNVGIALQAIEARKSPKSLGMKIGIVGHLLHRPLWVLGLVLGIVGIGPQVAALAWAPFAVVQTSLTAGLLLLLAIAVRYLGESVDRHAAAGVALLIAGVALVSWGAPGHAETHRAGFAVIAVVAGTAILAVLPFPLRGTRADRGLGLVLASGVGFAGTNIATKLGSDDLHAGHWWNAGLWAVSAIVLGVVATITGMSAFQRCTASVAVPISTAVQTFVPILLEPVFLREHFHSVSTQVLPIAAGVLVAVAGAALVGNNSGVAALASGR